MKLSGNGAGYIRKQLGRAVAEPTATTLYFDGSVRVNPGGPGAGGWVLTSNGVVVVEGWAFLPEAIKTTVNTAEWTGLCSGLEGVLDLLENDSELGCLQDLRVLTVIGDSRLVIDQCTGSFACRSHLLKPYFRRAAKVVSALSRKGITVGFKWVSRYHNVEADRMSKYGHAEENKALTQRVAEQNSFRLVV